MQYNKLLLGFSTSKAQLTFRSGKQVTVPVSAAANDPITISPSNNDGPTTRSSAAGDSGTVPSHSGCTIEEGRLSADPARRFMDFASSSLHSYRKLAEALTEPAGGESFQFLTLSVVKKRLQSLLTKPEETIKKTNMCDLKQLTTYKSTWTDRGREK